MSQAEESDADLQYIEQRMVIGETSTQERQHNDNEEEISPQRAVGLDEGMQLVSNTQRELKPTYLRERKV